MSDFSAVASVPLSEPERSEKDILNCGLTPYFVLTGGSCNDFFLIAFPVQ
jgi:hypothetical protein